jgi:hypothetical protein
MSVITLTDSPHSTNQSNPYDCIERRSGVYVSVCFTMYLLSRLGNLCTRNSQSENRSVVETRNNSHQRVKVVQFAKVLENERH